MNSTGAKIVADYLLGNFEFEMQTTVRVLAAVPNDKLAYQPDSLAKSGIGLVRHIVLIRACACRHLRASASRFEGS